MSQRDICRGRTERGRSVHWVAALLVLLVLLVLAAVAVVYLVERQDGADETQPVVPPALIEPPPPPGPGLVFDPVDPPSDVLDGLDPAKPISVPALRKRLGRLVSSPRLGDRLGLAVAELGDEGLLWRLGGPAPVMPASTMKLLTSVTALRQLGPEHRFATTVVSGRAPRGIVLVGGGDPLLTDRRLTGVEAAAAYPKPATLQALAAATASALQTAGRRAVTLSYDDSLFQGPAVSPAWEDDYVPDSIVSPITALWVDEGRAVEGLAQRVADPAAEAALRFAALLEARGVVVQGAVGPERAADGARRLASVSSPPLAQIVQHVLEVSDNEASEVLLRQAAVAAGRDASFEGGARTVVRTLTALGVDVSGSVIRDGSGLSRQNLLPIRALVSVLQVAADPAHPGLRTAVSALPVAGFTGSLDSRFVSYAPQGLGVVRAKTGTLTGVRGLAGVLVTRAGQALVFAAVADRVPRGIADAETQLDRIAAALAACGC